MSTATILVGMMANGGLLLQHCPKCDFEQSAAANECVRCGVVFSKLDAPPATRLTQEPRETITKPSSRMEFSDVRDWLLQRSLEVPERVNPIVLLGRGVLWAGLLLLSWGYVLSPIERSQMSPSFLHFLISRVNLVFHEAGHIIFGLLGDFLGTLGGSMAQVALPLICAVAFLRHADAFGATVATWWAGESLIELAPYINDARSQQLVLLGGFTGRDAPGYHDWNNLLSRLGLLTYDHTLAKIAHLFGAILILTALVWGGYLLLRQFQNRETYG